jgi:cytochrome P450
MNRQRYDQQLLQTEVTACICKESNKAVIKEMLRLHPPGQGRYVLLLKHAADTDFFAFLPFRAGPRICPGIYILAGFDTIENMLANLMYH